MADQYIILGLIKVDRGMIPSGASRNGQPILGQHIPYYAGLLMRNMRSFNLEFLDDYNSEILLNDIFRSQGQSLSQIVQNNRDYIDQNLQLFKTADLDAYLKEGKIRKAPRNSARMHKMAERISCGK